MAKSKYEYVKNFEREDVCPPNFWIVVKINGKGFTKYNGQESVDPEDIRPRKLMNCAAKTVMNEFRDIILAYGATDEFSFVFKRDTDLYNRREFKLASYIFSRFSSSIMSNWTKFFGDTRLEFRPFSVTTIVFPSDDDLKCYLACRQASVYDNNIKKSAWWHLDVPTQYQKTLSDDYSKDKDILLRQISPVDEINEIVRNLKGNIIIRKKIRNNAGKMKQSLVVVNGNIISEKFWEENPEILAERISSTHDNRNRKSGRRTQTRVHAEIRNLLKLNDISVTEENRFGYVKSFERNFICPENCWIVVRIDGKGFTKFCDAHQFTKPNDIRALELMNSAAEKVMNECSEIVLAFGASDEYSFVFKKDTKIYNRRESELISEVLWWFSTSYVRNWTKFFGNFRLKFPPSFDARVVLYPNNETLRDYLSWRQADVHVNNLYNTCFWNLIQQKSMTPSQAGERLKGTLSAEKNEILLQEFQIDYNNELPIVRKGSTLIRKKVSEEKVVTIHDDIIGDEFFHKNPEILGEEISSDAQVEDLGNCKRHDICLPNCWIVVTLKGKNFTKFCDAHQFVRPNDIRGLELMNQAAENVMNDCPDIILVFGANDEYSFVFKKNTKLYNRRETELSGYVLSRFSSSYDLNWNKFFGNTRLEFHPTFESKIDVYPSRQYLRDYLCHRQVDVHNDNLYNTCFWNLIQRQQMTPSQAEEKLKDTSLAFKNELLFQDFGINYNNELPIFRKGSALFLRNVPNDECDLEQHIVVIHEDIIGD